MKRPLAMVALLYAGGLLLAEVFQPPLPILFASSLSLALVAIGFARARSFLLWPLIACAGWTNLVWHAAIVSPHDLRVTQGDPAEIVSVRGMLAETPGQRMFVRDENESWRTMAQVKAGSLLKRGGWRPVFGEIIVTTPGLLPENFFAGQTVEITGVLAPPPIALAEGLFDFRTYLRRKEIYYQLKTESSNDWRMVGPVKTTAPLADRFRAWARKALALGLPDEDESLRLEWALTLGDKSVLTDDVSEPLVRAAT
jgi:hypothetical protein